MVELISLGSAILIVGVVILVCSLPEISKVRNAHRSATDMRSIMEAEGPHYRARELKHDLKNAMDRIRSSAAQGQVSCYCEARYPETIEALRAKGFNVKGNIVSW